MTDEPLDPAIFDEDRFRNLIELGIADHPDPRIGRFLRAGAQFVTYPLEGERVRIMLEFTEAAPALAALRAEVSGQEPEPIQDEDRDERIDVIIAPLGVLRRPPQG